ncbi:MAG: toll/interleukin-1 receptor domain-containing protein [Alphaproteobacteria bacterium]|nr:toll/interleukin-1 receptor domain-containing protein [Alphaproteobacteria bacterium]
MAGSDARAPERRYVAFLSYSHRDAAAARALHRRLESYRLPRRLVGGEGERGPVPARLTPIFRDREELPAADDLSERVRAALAVSDTLVILCSPAAAASPWVGKEIETFRALHPGRPIIAAILEGEPAEAFPPPLCAGGVEPLAADLRPGRDGRRLGFLKLVAGLSGVGLDALVQRDAQRRLRRVTAVTGVALAAVVAMAVLTLVALQARREAQRQRAEAEGLVEFMLTDLRDRLKGVGRLDAMQAVNGRALDHYHRQDLAKLDADALERRARILQTMAEDDDQLGRPDQLEADAAEAYRTTSALLGAEPRDPQRIYAHAQSEYWVGYAGYLKDDWARAGLHWLGYERLAKRLTALDAAKADWVRELAYAEGNLCTLYLARKAPRAALPQCLRSLADMERVRRLRPRERKPVQDVANRYAWASAAWAGVGNIARAEASQRAYLGELQRLGDRYPGEADVQDQLMRALMTTAEFLSANGRAAEGETYRKQAQILADHLTALDPANRRWRAWQTRIANTPSGKGESK